MAKAKKAAKAGKKGAAPKKKSGGFAYKILGFLLLILALLLLPTSTLLACGMFPTIVAYLTDSDRRKTAAISVGTVNLCGVLPFLLTLWMGQNNSMKEVGDILRHVETWAIMYGAAALGSLIHYAVPPVIAGFISLQSSSRVAELERRQTALKEAWGEEVAATGAVARVRAVNPKISAA